MIKVLPKIFSRSRQIDWRRTENLLRLELFLAVIGTASAAILLHNHIALQQAGYLGVALTALLASGSMILPVPALATVCAASAFLVPLYVGLVAGGAETVGELTGAAAVGEWWARGASLSGWEPGCAGGDGCCCFSWPSFPTRSLGTWPV